MQYSIYKDILLNYMAEHFLCEIVWEILLGKLEAL